MLVVTHDPPVAALCDRVLFLEDGRLERELRPSSAEDVAAVLVFLSPVPEGWPCCTCTRQSCATRGVR